MRFNFRLAFRLLGTLMLIMAGAMLPPVGVALYYGDASRFGLLLSAFVILSVGLFLKNFAGAGARNDVDERDSMLLTAIVWIAIPMMGALPYLFTGAVHSFTDAAFESFSGFTTTGSSVHPQQPREVKSAALPLPPPRRGCWFGGRWRNGLGGWVLFSSWWLCSEGLTPAAHGCMRPSFRGPYSGGCTPK